MHLLERLLGKLSAKTRQQIETLDVDQVEKLGEALIEFKSEKALTAWLRKNVTVGELIRSGIFLHPC